ncbi:uncharacterized protein BO95DRAFT_90519 [Aspergillus brunneoviolaceus CBS 621.78]|uniref:Uncharacterized protein n=1 Tax=Aspergillus brunneoviolaceus CBS 621.78 TaxID=1450534 RepID=A0ACD1GD43_9EURO|nr:hypothetical protein BO95DRAFT_90519 [Aspergillus brunneoviolaceus CBS 621.78]RAH47088.1 hypothetical protein BO95DRAFT_90519 [Aspergillus brunneoviolaceus CBS 621.78]
MLWLLEGTASRPTRPPPMKPDSHNKSIRPTRAGKRSHCLSGSRSTNHTPDETTEHHQQSSICPDPNNHDDTTARYIG